jgi:hypothetical protein
LLSDDFFNALFDIRHVMAPLGMCCGKCAHFIRVCALKNYFQCLTLNRLKLQPTAEIS